MRILVDAGCASFGGIKTYVDGLLTAWNPSDDVHVLVDSDAPPQVPAHMTVHQVNFPSPRSLTRPWAQTQKLQQLAKELQPDRVLCTLPSTSLRKFKAPTAVVVYDLRHELRPEQFSVLNRVQRRVSYSRGYQIADGFISISNRTMRDLAKLHPKTQQLPNQAIHLGADHVQNWAQGDRNHKAICFVHQTSKNYSLILDAWELAKNKLPELVLVGAAADRKAWFHAEIAARGLTERVQLSPYLADQEFQQLFTGASLIVFPSDFEGFGLPAVEALLAGVPVVIGPEPAVTEVTAGHGWQMMDWTPTALVAAATAALQATPAQNRAGMEYARTLTWQRTADETREFLIKLS